MSEIDRAKALALCAELECIKGKLTIYEQLLRRWQSKVNLVGPKTLSDLWVRHFADSAQVAQVEPLDQKWADLGSGAGFPGMVVALLQRNRPGSEMHLIESDTRKAAFLREVSRETGSGAFIHNARCEDVLASIQPSVITSRAMADLGNLVRLSAPLVDKGATCLFLKGRDVASELTESSIPSRFSLALFKSRIDPDSSIVRIQSTHAALPGG